MVCIEAACGKPLSKQISCDVNCTFDYSEVQSSQVVKLIHSFIEYIQEALDNHYYIIGIFLDLTKAYDVVNHDILLNKLDLYGNRGVTKLWFKSYFSNRTQFVEITQVDEQKRTQDTYWCLENSYVESLKD
jgi:hypothetical protein